MTVQAASKFVSDVENDAMQNVIKEIEECVNEMKLFLEFPGVDACKQCRDEIDLIECHLGELKILSAAKVESEAH